MLDFAHSIMQPADKKDSEFEKPKFKLFSEDNSGLPKWVEMKCNSLVYLKQVMKNTKHAKDKKKHPRSHQKIASNTPVINKILNFYA